MKIIFEFDDETWVSVWGLKYNKIEERTQENLLVDRYISDPHKTNMYIISDRNNLTPNGKMRLNRKSNIDYIIERIFGYHSLVLGWDKK